MTFTLAWSTEPLKVIYRDSSGAETVREQGSRSWRNCNPGNIRPGSFTALHGAIGSAGDFAIFPDEDIGFAAIIALLKTPAYQKMSVLQAFANYATAGDNNDPVASAHSVSHQTGLPTSQVLNTCTDADMTRLAGAIKSPSSKSGLGFNVLRRGGAA